MTLKHNRCANCGDLFYKGDGHFSACDRCSAKVDAKRTEPISPKCKGRTMAGLPILMGIKGTGGVR